MDSLTQIVLGSAVGEAVLGKKVGNKALLYGAIAGTIPDMDVVANFFTDTITSIELHRGFSHSIVFAILFAPILGWTVNKIERGHQLGWKTWAKLFFWGLFTHPILDAFTTWGTRLFWPFDIRLAFNSIFVIDPLYTLPFLICVILVLFFNRNSKTRRRINQIGLTLSTVYLMSTLFLKQVVNKKFEAALVAQNIPFLKISSRPAALNTILWNANVETENSYWIGDHSFFDTAPIQFVEYPKNRRASQKLEAYPNVQRLITISEGWYILEEKNQQWFFYDLRFGLIPRKDQPPFFAFEYLLEKQNGSIQATETEKTGRDAQYLLSVLWKRIKGKSG
ncbi:MAG: metal-dependent hydrolase [Bacteroidota bacterium]